MTGMIAGIGFRAILGGVASKAASAGGAVLAFLKAHSVWLTVSIALASCWGIDHVISHRHAAKVEKQLATANNELVTSRANDAALKKAIADQNAAIASIAAKSAQQQNTAAKASEAAQERAHEAEATAARLRAGAHAAGVSAANCEPSDTLKGQWK